MYVDEYGFTPLPDRLAQRLHDISQGNDAGSYFDLPDFDDRDDELERLGYLSNVRRYLSGNGIALLTSKGACYEDELRGYLERRGRYEEEQREEERRSRRHDWKLNVVNGVYGIAGIVVGAILGWLLG